MTITGTWEEIAALGDKLSGKEVTLMTTHPSDTEDVIRTRYPLSHEQLEQLRESARQVLTAHWPEGLSAVDALREDRR